MLLRPLGRTVLVLPSAHPPSVPQAGSSVAVPPEDRRNLVLGLVLHDKAKATMKRVGGWVADRRGVFDQLAAQFGSMGKSRLKLWEFVF